MSCSDSVAVDLGQRVGVHVVDEPADSIAMRQKPGVPQARDRLANVGLDVGEGLDREGRRDSRVGLKLRAEAVVGDLLEPQSVWWITITDSVFRIRCEIASDLITSSVTTPPALRRMWAWPSSRPSAAKTSRRESMHVTIARRSVGWMSTWWATWLVWLCASSSSITSIAPAV